MPRLGILILGTLVLVVGASAAVLRAGDDRAHAGPAHPRHRTAGRSQLTVRSTETLIGDDVTDGGIAAKGRFSMSGALTDTGSITDYRTVKGGVAFIRRVAVGERGTITFLIAIHLDDPGPAPWKITSATRTYKDVRGTGRQVVDRYYETPATFVLSGTVARV